MIDKKELYEAAKNWMQVEKNVCEANGMAERATHIANNLEAIDRVLFMLWCTDGQMKKYQYKNLETGEVVYADSGAEMDSITAGDKTWYGAQVKVTEVETGEENLLFPVTFF